MKDREAVAVDSAALEVEALVAVAQADLGKTVQDELLEDIEYKKEPPFGGSFNAYLLS